MINLLTKEQAAGYEECKEFVTLNVGAPAEMWDREGKIPDLLIASVGQAGYLGALIPPEFGGKGWDCIRYGLLNEAFGRGMSSLTGLLTVQSMVSTALMKWGTDEQKRQWLPSLATGEVIGAFALTEPGAGSDIQSIATSFREDGGAFILNGEKKWITFAQSAGVFLVFGKLDDKPLACLVPRDATGLQVIPIEHMMGFRAARLGRVLFDNVKVPRSDIVGKPGAALTYVAPIGLQYGRISTACAALGLLRGCFEESISYASERHIQGSTLSRLGMIQSLIARMGTDMSAAALLCYSACRAEDAHSPDAFEKTLAAKYFVSRAAVQAASDAVQIRGASGCEESCAVARYYRDAKITEIIEGTTQVHEILLGKIYVAKNRRRRKI